MAEQEYGTSEETVRSVSQVLAQMEGGGGQAQASQSEDSLLDPLKDMVSDSYNKVISEFKSAASNKIRDVMVGGIADFAPSVFELDEDGKLAIKDGAFDSIKPTYNTREGTALNSKFAAKENTGASYPLNNDDAKQSSQQSSNTKSNLPPDESLKILQADGKLTYGADFINNLSDADKYRLAQFSGLIGDDKLKEQLVHDYAVVTNGNDIVSRNDAVNKPAVKDKTEKLADGAVGGKENSTWYTNRYGKVEEPVVEETVAVSEPEPEPEIEENEFGYAPITPELEDDYESTKTPDVVEPVAKEESPAVQTKSLERQIAEEEVKSFGQPTLESPGISLGM